MITHMYATFILHQGVMKRRKKENLSPMNTLLLVRQRVSILIIRNIGHKNLNMEITINEPNKHWSYWELCREINLLHCLSEHNIEKLAYQG